MNAYPDLSLESSIFAKFFGMNFRALFNSYLPFYKRNLRVAIPIILSQLGGGIVQLVDTFMVSRLGTIELAAVSFANAVFIVGFVFVNGILQGATPLIGQAFVRQEKEKITELFQNSVLIAFFLSIIIVILMYSISLIMHRMGQVSEIVILAIPYYRILVWSLIPFLFYTACKQFLEGLGNTKVAMIITITANVVNIIFNYLLIFGKYGFPELGVYGAGVSTFISRLIMPVMFLLFLRFHAQWWSFCRNFRWRLFSRKGINELLAIGLPIAGHILLEVSAFALSGIMVGWLGAAPLAGHQIAQNMSHLVFMVVLGISAATTIRISHQYGVRDFKALKMAANASVHLCLLINIITGSLLVIFRYQIAGFFSLDPVVVNIGAQLLIMVGIFQLSDGLQAVGAGVLRGLTDVKKPMLYAFISYICINLPVGYLLAFVFKMGAVGVWAGFIFGLSIAAILFHRRCRKKITLLEKEYTQGLL